MARENEAVSNRASALCWVAVTVRSQGSISSTVAPYMNGTSHNEETEKDMMSTFEKSATFVQQWVERCVLIQRHFADSDHLYI